MIIKRENMRQRLCPLCGNDIGTNPLMVEIKLNNKTVMPQPVCEKDKALMETIECQKEVLRVARMIWVDEIYSSTQFNREQKDLEIERIMKLEVI